LRWRGCGSLSRDLEVARRLLGRNLVVSIDFIRLRLRDVASQFVHLITVIFFDVFQVFAVIRSRFIGTSSSSSSSWSRRFWLLFLIGQRLRDGGHVFDHLERRRLIRLLIGFLLCHFRLIIPDFVRIGVSVLLLLLLSRRFFIHRHRRVVFRGFRLSRLSLEFLLSCFVGVKINRSIELLNR